MLSKDPIRVEPSDAAELHRASRINFGKTYTVEHNVKVQKIGKVAKEHLPFLKNYWKLACQD
jgi:hypothetical protein